MDAHVFYNFLSTHSPILILAVPLIAAFLTPFISRISDKGRNVFVISALIASFIVALILARDIYLNGTRIYVFGAASPGITVPSGMRLPVRIMYEVDGMSIFMVFITLIISIAASIYSWSYIEKETGKGRYYTLLLLMVVGMLGMELTGDLFNLFVFFEILSIASTALVAYQLESDSVEGSFKYMVLSAVAGLFVLVAVALLYSQYNALNMAALAQNIKYTRLDIIALGILISAFAMKCGVVPMHMVTPDAYTVAPGGIAAMMVAASQASLYAMFRTSFTIFGNAIVKVNAVSLVGALIILFGVLTMLIGITMALVQKDIKRTVAYAAVGEIGFMLLGIGVGFATMGANIKAIEGGIFHIINDSLDIGLMFLAVGAVIYATNERNMDKLGGLAHSMKWTSIFFIIGLLAVSGMPPMNGFASKLLIYESVYQFSPLLSIIAILASIILLAIFVKIFHSVFMGPELSQYKEIKDVPKSMIAGMCVLTAVIVLFSLFPDWAVSTIVRPAADALINYGGYIEKVMGGG